MILKSGTQRSRGGGIIIAAICLGLAGFPRSLVRGAEVSPALQLAQQLNEVFANVAEKASPSVVVIDVIQNVDEASPVEADESSLDGVPPEIWRYFRERAGKRVADSVPGEGSGVVIREDGYILTNGHVVEDAESIKVRLHDGRTFRASIRGIDRQSDVAVIKIEAKNLIVARMGDSAKTRVGEFAIAIGAPYDLDYTVTFGHISAKGRSNVIRGRTGEGLEQDYLQTDALINPGNSGGPLLNLNGEVIGINTMIHGLHTGIGFAIPSNLAKEISDKLISDGKFVRPWLGVEVRSLRDDPEARDASKGVDDGLVISRIVPDGPAAKSDLERSDVITAVDGKPVRTAQELRGQIRGKALDKSIVLDVYRHGVEGGRAIKVPVKLAEWVVNGSKPSRPVSTDAQENYLTESGITVHKLAGELAARFAEGRTNGVFVLAVEAKTPAARLGIQLGDIITAVDAHPVTSPKQFRDLLKAANLTNGVSLNIIRENKPRSEVLKPNND